MSPVAAASERCVRALYWVQLILIEQASTFVQLALQPGTVDCVG
jgi:hypothetical protein